MESALADALCAALLHEVVPALGCTEPVAIALAAAKAREVLGGAPDHVTVRCSGNVVKNARSVTVPHSGGRHGIALAAALGITGGVASAALECLDALTEAQVDAACELVARGAVDVGVAEGTEGVYVDVLVARDDRTARAVLDGDHSRFAQVLRDGVPVTPSSAGPVGGIPQGRMPEATLAEILAVVRALDLESRPALVARLDQQVALNSRVADEGLEHGYGAQIGRTLLAHAGDGDVRLRARARAAAAADARMGGCPLPVMINAGSGNQGLTVSVPVVTHAASIGAGEDELHRALVLANLVALQQKALVGRLSAFCGAVSAAAAAAAGIALLDGMSDAEILRTVETTLATTGGMVCDGAKPSCAAKVSVALEGALDALELTRRGLGFDDGDGLVGATPDDTVRAVGRMARDGMRGTDAELLAIMIEHDAAAG